MPSQLKICLDLRGKAYALIKEKILFLHLRPGEKIFEKDIAKDIKSSRTPVREALLTLQNEGLVECDPRLGYIVKAFNQKEIEELFGVRKALELFAVPLILDHITSTEIQQLKSNIQSAKRNIDGHDLRSLIRRESEFHQILYKSTCSQVFYDIISKLVDRLQVIRALALFTQDGPHLSLHQHSEILSAIERKDSRRLRKLIEVHVDSALQIYRMSPAVAFTKDD